MHASVAQAMPCERLFHHPAKGPKRRCSRCLGLRDSVRYHVRTGRDLLVHCLGGGGAMKRALVCLFTWSASAWAQQPVISPGGVVNAASYTAGISPLTTSGFPQTGGGPTLVPGFFPSTFGPKSPRS